eukprot:CAMPEP_0182444056 /NCGR_PEP_ID=MMETSP1172-20130603/2624_1 /TAXON_ID=708627 /ORGANISM="Timspurckia oligopyrenoides, Strain CCMP3278" /LENGTH=212 /DNA_ID=CAMNT_0024639515 /DNA_START=121 /DNA_END=759 /DNA_ORIENTATION=+
MNSIVNVYSSSLESTRKELDNKGSSGLSVLVETEEALHSLAGKLARRIQTGDCLLLKGEMGVGKSSFARGYIRQALLDPVLQVTSPTFLLDNVYCRDTDELPVEIHHMDLWRLSDAESRNFVDFGYVFTQCVSLIEWPDRLGELLTPDDRLDVNLYLTDKPDLDKILESGELPEQSRRVDLDPHGIEWTERINQIKSEILQMPTQSGLKVIS